MKVWSRPVLKTVSALILLETNLILIGGEFQNQALKGLNTVLLIIAPIFWSLGTLIY